MRTIVAFACLEYEHPMGSKGRGRTIFESVLDAHPKRADVWAVFVDKETKAGQIDAARALLARSATLKWRTHAMKALFKRWLRFEQQHGDASTVASVKDKAREYVASLTQ